MGRAVGQHELDRIEVVNHDKANYFCKCGAKGTATYGAVLHTRQQLEKRAEFNHSLHRLRKLIKEGN